MTETTCPNCTKPSSNKRYASLFCNACQHRWKRYGNPNGGGPASGRARDFFYANVDADTDECILWPFALTRGYGEMNINRRPRGVHVLSCERHHGPRPEGTEAAHSCGVPSCFNPRHLRWATSEENSSDRILHGTYSSRLTAQNALDIRSRVASGERQVDLAREFGVSRSYVSAIVHVRSWKGLAGAAVAAGVLLGAGGVAGAHTPTHGASCEAGIFTSGTQYQGGKVTLQIGTSSVQHTFTGGSFSYTLPNPDKTIVEAWKIVIDANDGNEFDVTYQGSVQPCQTAPTTSTTQPAASSTTTSSPAPATTPSSSSSSTSTTLPPQTTSPTTEAPATTATSSPSSTPITTSPTSSTTPASSPGTPSTARATTSSPTSEPVLAVGAPPKPPTPQTELPATGTETTAAALLAGLALAGGTGLTLIARRRA